jgi:hypothetical protein
MAPRIEGACGSVRVRDSAVGRGSAPALIEATLIWLPVLIIDVAGPDGEGLGFACTPHRSLATVAGDRPPARTATQFLNFLQCAPMARVTSGGRFHPEDCRLLW